MTRPKLTEAFFARDPRSVAKELIGRHLVREIGESRTVGMITEAGAFRGGNRRGLRYGPGMIYVAIFQGGYPTLCIGTDSEGTPSVVTVRKAYPVEGFTETIDGSGDLSRVFRIDKDLDNTSINERPLYIAGEGLEESRVTFISPDMEKMAPNCLGYYRMK